MKSVISAMVAVAAVISAFATTAPAEAAVCKERIAGSSISTGMLGLGSKRARANSVANWEANVAAAYGRRFANFESSRGKEWSCKSGVLNAKCVVSAKPCR